VIARVGQPIPDSSPKQIAWEETKGWTADDIVKKVRGPKGTTVEISIRRPGVDALIDLTVMRDEITITTVRTAFMLAPGTGYIRMQDFSETTDGEIGAALTKLKSEGMQRLMLDIRDNPGGPLDQAIAVASRFLKSGQMVVYTRGRVRGTDEDYRARGQAPLDVPMIVMVNRNSASASEIVSGAMQDHDRAILVGETTWGKALVQGVYNVSEDAGVALTTAHYFTPNTRTIQASSSTPTRAARSSAAAASSPIISWRDRSKDSTRPASEGCCVTAVHSSDSPSASPRKAIRVRERSRRPSTRSRRAGRSQTKWSRNSVTT
jgi:C-terminal peptidase prc